MKNIFKICIVLFTLSSNLYSQNWLWVKPQNINTTNPLIGNTRLTSSGNLVTFLAEPGGSHLQFVDGNGNVLWSQFFTNLTIFDVCTDGSDNIYFAGTYTTNTTIGTTNFVSQGGADALIGEFNSSGTLIKSKSFGTSSSEYAKSIALSNNQLYVTGSFINSQMVNSVSLTGNGSTFNTYVLKFDMNFVAQTGVETVSQGCDGLEVAVDQVGSVYLLGNSQYTLSIGTQSVYIAQDGQYFAKLTGNLSIVWLNAINTHFMGGSYNPFMYFDNSSNITLTHVTGGGGGSDYHLRIEKYNPAGSQIWYQNVMVNEFDFVDQDNMDNIWVAGGYINGANPPTFSIVKINSTNTSTVQLIWDPNILHSVLGLASKSNNDFYIIGNCNTGSNLNSYTCSPSNSVFMTHYGTATSSGIKNNTASANTFNVYPNPATGILTLSCESGIKSGCTLIIKNILGQLVYRDPMKETSGSFSKDVDLSNQPKGTYFVEMESDQERTIKRVIVQ